jgi:peptide/nickel transport system ATP-binding protein
MTAPVLRVEHLSRSFLVSRAGAGRRELKAVDDVSFEIGPAETLGVVGESGCGKTTVARMILKLLPATGGRIELEGRDVTDLDERAMRPLRKSMHAVFQDPLSSLNPRLRVRDIVAEPLRSQGTGRRAIAERVREILGVVGLSAEAGERFPHAFSGGQRQRIAIARALAAAPRFVVCDEATSALDVSVQAQILNLLADLQQRFGLSLLFISHNLGAVRHLSHRVAVMYLGRIVEVGPERDIFDRPAHPYTIALLAAVPEPVIDQPAVAPLTGEIPSAFDRPSGCHFHPRCPKAQPTCRAEDPPLRPRRDGHLVRCHFPE